jgi:hypothetical protein
MRTTHSPLSLDKSCNFLDTAALIAKQRLVFDAGDAFKLTHIEEVQP